MRTRQNKFTTKLQQKGDMKLRNNEQVVNKKKNTTSKRVGSNNSYTIRGKQQNTDVWILKHNADRFKHKPIWAETSPLDNLEFYRNEQRVLIDELIGNDYENKKSDDTPTLKSTNFRGSFDSHNYENFFNDSDILKTAHMNAANSFKHAVKSKRWDTPEYETPKEELNSGIPYLNRSPKQLSAEQVKQQYPSLYRKVLKYSTILKNEWNKSQDSTQAKREDKKEPKQFSDISVQSVDSKMTDTQTDDIPVHSPGFSDLLEDQKQHILKEVGQGRDRDNLIETISLKNGNDILSEKYSNLQEQINTTIQTEREKEILLTKIKNHVSEVTSKEQIEREPGEETISPKGIVYTNYQIERKEEGRDSFTNIEYARVQHGLADQVELYFEEQAQKMVNHTIKLLSHELLNHMLLNRLNDSEQRDESRPIPILVPSLDPVKYGTLAGAILTPEIIQYCMENNISLNDSVISSITGDIVEDIVKLMVVGEPHGDVVNNTGSLKVIETEVKEISNSQKHPTEHIVRLILMLMSRNLGMEVTDERVQTRETSTITEEKGTLVQSTSIQTEETVTKLKEAESSTILPDSRQMATTTPTQEEIDKTAITRARENEGDMYPNHPQFTYFVLSDLQTQNEVTDTIQYSHFSNIGQDTSQLSSAAMQEPIMEVSREEVKKERKQVTYYSEVEIQTIDNNEVIVPSNMAPPLLETVGSQTKQPRLYDTHTQANTETYSVTIQTSVESDKGIQTNQEANVDEEIRNTQRQEPLSDSESNYTATSDSEQYMDYGSDTERDEEKSIPKDRLLFPLLQESSIERKLRMELLNRRKVMMDILNSNPNAVGDEDEYSTSSEYSERSSNASIGVSTISSQDTFSTYSRADSTRYAHEMVHEALETILHHNLSPKEIPDNSEVAFDIQSSVSSYDLSPIDHSSSGSSIPSFLIQSFHNRKPPFATVPTRNGRIEPEALDSFTTSEPTSYENDSMAFVLGEDSSWVTSENSHSFSLTL